MKDRFEDAGAVALRFLTLTNVRAQITQNTSGQKALVVGEIQNPVASQRFRAS